jgi:hypothetical protein
LDESGWTHHGYILLSLLVIGLELDVVEPLKYLSLLTSIGTLSLNESSHHNFSRQFEFVDLHNIV